MNSWFERDPDRHKAEADFWTGLRFADDSRAGQLAFRGTVQVTAGTKNDGPINQQFDVRVEYPHAFPYRPPKFEFIEPRIRRARHQSPGGDPCLMPPHAWDAEMPASEVHKALLHWLKAYLVGSFPREQAIYELPEYFAYSPLTVLTSDQVPAVFADRDSGRFSILEAEARDLGVLKSVDGVQIGQELIEGLRFAREVKRLTRKGRWFRLSQEPPPLRHTGELQRLLKKEGHHLDIKRAPELDHGLIGLVFHDQVLEQERLLLLDYRASSRKDQPAPQGWPLACPWNFPVSPQDLFLRLQGVSDVVTLHEKNLVVLGVGAIGSSAAADLTRAGVGGLVLCDPDRLRPGNVMRHELDLFSVGQHKAQAMESALGRINPFIEGRHETEHLLEPGVLANHMRTDHPATPAHLVISAIGNNATEGLISEIAVSQQTAPVLFVRTLHDGAVVRMMLLRPGENDACMWCLDLHHRDGHSDLIDVPDSQTDPVFDAGCATASLPGAGLTSRQAAVFAAKRSLALLLGEDQPHNHWLWLAEPILDAEDERLHQAEQMYAAHIPRHPECPICN